MSRQKISISVPSALRARMTAIEKTPNWSRICAEAIAKACEAEEWGSLSGFERWRLGRIQNPADRAAMIALALEEVAVGVPLEPPSGMDDPHWHNGEWWESDELIDHVEKLKAESTTPD